MSKHTAGPWRVENDTDIIGTENDPANGCVGPVDVAHVYQRTVAGRTKANARLIAAAPELLAALTRTEDYLRNCCGSAKIANFCKAAIAKATGEPA